ncbi:MAG TPA: universal stress protein [Opitutaceae bacterium]|nr:universal stress protein [Opitutaceae bacterium]
MKTILAPIDFSPITERVCAAALSLAKAVGGRVILLHSVPPPIITSEYSPMIENMAEITASGEKAAARRLARLQKKLQDRLVVLEVLQTCGAPVPQVLEQAGLLGADYIVMGSHGHTALYELLAGSTAHGVLRKAPCPVLIVPPAIKAARKVKR